MFNQPWALMADGHAAQPRLSDIVFDELDRQASTSEPLRKTRGLLRYSTSQEHSRALHVDRTDLGGGKARRARRRAGRATEALRGGEHVLPVHPGNRPLSLLPRSRLPVVQLISCPVSRSTARSTHCSCRLSRVALPPYARHEQRPAPLLKAHPLTLERCDLDVPFVRVLAQERDQMLMRRTACCSAVELRELLETANRALYAAKANGRNRVKAAPASYTSAPPTKVAGSPT